MEAKGGGALVQCSRCVFLTVDKLSHVEHESAMQTSFFYLQRAWFYSVFGDHALGMPRIGLLRSARRRTLEHRIMMAF